MNGLDAAPRTETVDAYSTAAGVQSVRGQARGAASPSGRDFRTGFQITGCGYFGQQSPKPSRSHRGVTTTTFPDYSFPNRGNRVRPSSEREELPAHLRWLAVPVHGQSFATFDEAD